jgi:hypothetical protein
LHPESRFLSGGSGCFSKDAPPLFVAAANDDNFGFHMRCIELYQKWIAAGKNITKHLYAKGGTGLGMRTLNTETDNWIERFGEWLKARGLWAR